MKKLSKLWQQCCWVSCFGTRQMSIFNKTERSHSIFWRIEFCPDI